MFGRVITKFLDRVHFKWDPEDVRRWLSSGSVIFVTLECDWLDLLVLNYNLKRAGIPKIQWTNALPGVLSLGVFRGLWRAIRLFFWFITFKSFEAPVKKRKDEWLYAVREHKPVLLTFPENEPRKYRRGPESEEWLANLLRVSQERGLQVRLLPFYLFWRRSGMSKRADFWNIVLGSPNSPRAWRKILQLFRVHPHFSFSVLDAYTLNAEVDIHDTEIKMLAKQWRRKCIIDLVAARRVLLGPAERSADYLMDQLLSNPEFENRLNEMGEKQGVPPIQVPYLAQKYFQEIAARFNFFVVELYSAFLQWLWRVLYTRIDFSQPELDELAHLNQTGSLIFIPCHKSHMDYLLVSDVLFRHGIVPPHIAAGVNLAFWPFGAIARRGGAFFIRRSFKGEHLYSEVLQQYLGALIKDRYNIEFFIEGGRSRTGRMLPPKYGLLKMIYEMYEGEDIKDAFIIPTFIGYDQIIEIGAYKRELGGQAKKSESGLDLIRSIRYIRHKYGKVYLRFGKPVSVKSLIVHDEERKPLAIEKAAFQISRFILKKGVVTPSSLLAVAYLGSDWKEVHRDTWISTAADIMKYFQARGAEIDEETRVNPFETLNAAINSLITAKSIVISPVASNRLFVPRRKRFDLSIYKNHVAHWMLVDSTGMILSRVSKLSDDDSARKLRALLKFEYFLPSTAEWIAQLSEKRWEAYPDAVKHALSRCYADIIESYLFCLRALSKKRGQSFMEDEFTKILRTDVQGASRGRLFRFPEGAVLSNYKSFTKVALQLGVLTSEKKRDKAVLTVTGAAVIDEWLPFLEKVYQALLPARP